MWGVDIGRLNVYYTTSQMKTPQLAWHLQGNQGNLWKFVQVSFDVDIAEVGNDLILGKRKENLEIPTKYIK